MKITNKFTPRYLFMAVFLGLAAIPARTQPNWSVVSTDYEFTMTVTGIANIDCIESLDTNDIVAAFIGDEVRGVQPVREFYNGHAFAFMIVYDNVFSGNAIHFKIYDASEDQVIDAMGNLTFQENQNLGSTELPHVFRNEPGVNQILASTYSISKFAHASEVVSTLTSWNETGETPDVVYSWINDATGDDNDLFTLAGNQLLLNESASSITEDTLYLHLRATPGNGCSLDYAFHLLLVDPGTAVEYVYDIEKLNFFPNPTHGIVRWNNPASFERIMITDIQGNPIYQEVLETASELDLSVLVPGMYVIRMVGEEINGVGMLMKE